jgi:hypothetical protein
LFIAEGKGGHQRVIPISNTFFVAVGDYLRREVEVAGRDWSAVAGCDDEVVVLPIGAGDRALFGLEPPVCLERRRDRLVDRDRAP